MRTNQLIRLGAMALVSAALLSVVGCEKKNGSIEPNTQTTLTASMEQQGSDTKTTLVGQEVRWSSGDKIAVFFGDVTTRNEFTLASGQGTKSATFTGSGSDAKAYAFYPYSAGVTISSDKTISFTLPSEQTYRPEGGFATDMNPMVAYRTAEGTLEFKNLCGILKITLNASSGKTIKRIIVRSQTTKLSGKATVAMTYTAGNPEIVMASDAEYTVALNLGTSGVTLNANTDFYIVVPPIDVKADNKLTVHVESTTGGMLKSTTKTAAAITRNIIMSMPAFDYADVANKYLENGLDFGAGVTVDGTTFAPVNCGYEPATESPAYKGYTYGKLYQWGRRDGGGYNTTDDHSVQTAEAATWSGGVFQNNGGTPAADKFYTTSDLPNDWYSNNSSKQLTAWTNDPCPAGWRVPTEAELTKVKGTTASLTTGKHGSTDNLQGVSRADGKLFFPVAGYRSIGGSDRKRGNGGSYWSSDVSVTKAPNWDFNNDDSSMYYNYRAFGFSVRCVKN